MKQRVREATFNLLGPDPKGKCVIDLFAGTGALAIEAISRGAAEAIMIEKHFPTAKLIEDTIRQLQIKAPCQVLGGDAFYWGSRLEITSTLPWLLFCSPPYALYQSHQQEMLALLTCLLEKAPTESVVVVEADQEFDPQLLPAAEDWRVRDYPPARICLLRKE